MKRANVLTSFFYLSAAAVAFAHLTPLSIITAGGALVLAFTSARFHRTKRYRDQRMDRFGMYATFTPLAVQAVGKFLPFVPGLVLALLALGIVVFLAYDLERFDSFKVLGLLVAVTLIGIAKAAGVLPALGILAIFGAAFLARHLDVPRGHGPVHAVWHLETNLAIILSIVALF